MHYTTVYNIATQPYDGWIWFILAGVFLVLILVSFGVFNTPVPGLNTPSLYPIRYWVVGFAVVIAGIAALSYWDFSRLQKNLQTNDCQRLDGVIQGHWEKKWVEGDRSKSSNWKHYEGFTVNTVSFGYFINAAEHAGFQNSDSVQIPLYDGLPVRIHYITDKHIDDGTLENRILKLEIGR